jgi:hypothetical protein
VAQREADRGKVAYRDGFNRVSELDRALRQETPHMGMWLDNSDQEPDATVNEIIMRGLDAGRIE